MQAATSLLEDLVSDGLSKEQKREVQEWDKKIDAAINIAKVFPQVKEKLNEEIDKLTGGNLDIDQVDHLIHAVLNKH